MTNATRTASHETSPDGLDAQDRARRGHPLPDHLHLDPDAGPVQHALKTDPTCILGSGSDTGVLVGTVLELIVALAGIGTAVALYPVVKRQNEGVALGFVTSRIIEGAMIFTGCREPALARDPAAGPGRRGRRPMLPRSSPRARRSPPTYNGTFLVGQTLMPVDQRPPARAPCCTGPASCRVSCPCSVSSGRPSSSRRSSRQLLRRQRRTSPRGPCSRALPIAVWEFSLGLYLTFKGFKASAPIMVAAAAEAGQPGRPPATAVRPRPPSSRRRRVRHDRRPGAGRGESRRDWSSVSPGCCTAHSFGSAADGSGSGLRATSSGCCA